MEDNKLSKAEIEEIENPITDEEKTSDNSFENMDNEDIIACLLSADADEKPTRVIPIKRENGLCFPVTLKAITGKQLYRIRSRNTRSINTKNGNVDKLDTEGFNIGLITAATVAPNWGDPRLLKKYRASSGDEVLKRILLAGEISLLGDAVLDISGFNITLDDIKNL